VLMRRRLACLHRSQAVPAAVGRGAGCRLSSRLSIPTVQSASGDAHLR
jgi:hypothetical protein